MHRYLTLALALTLAAAEAQAAEALSVESIFGSRSLFKTLPSAVEWLGNSRGVSFVRKTEGDPARTELVLRGVPSGRERVIVVADTVAVPLDLQPDHPKFSIGDHQWNRAGDRAVFTFAGDIFLVDTRGRITRVTDTDGAEKDPSFSPDGRRLAFTRGNDLYTLDVKDGDYPETRLTTTGSETLLNGVLDWVYMEELFTRGDVRAHWWSPDGERLAFLEFDESPVPTHPLVDQVPLQATATFQRYPKPGDPNPIVRVGIVPARGGSVVWADTDTRDDSYIARVYWTGDGRAVAIEKLNRAQDRWTVLFADAATGRSDVILEESSPAWINVTYARHYYSRKRQFLVGSERDGHHHLYLFNLDGSLIRPVTRGVWEVVELEAVDEKKGRVYFVANQSSVLEHHLYRIDDNGKNLARITTEEGSHDVDVSPDRKYFVDRYSSHARPTRISVHTIEGKRLFDIADQLSPELAAMRLPTAEFFTVEDEGSLFHCRLWKPLDFDANKKHPAIVYVYGGPHSQVVRKAWSRHDLWHAYMATRGYLVFSIDNRGSAGRGKAWEELLLKRLGTIELEDQLTGVDYLKSLPYVDPERIGVWGWSYGGTMALNALFRAPGVFRAGVSVAPVADWRLYDSIYTERYMKRPQDNESGYTEAATTTHAAKLEDALLLMHGDADDNVHMQNSIALVRKLIDAGKDFELMIYPQKEHGIAGSADRTHLYRKMTAFFDRHLGASDPAPKPAVP
ncbi:MAG: alpha/beta fold hydrolase [Candidatus Latescibacteria bacterium]|nr:alpha/beta fold hydrolase [Candidatus Latescibacterota bacterium]